MRKGIRRLLCAAGMMLAMVCAAGMALAASTAVQFCWTAEGRQVFISLHQSKNKAFYLFQPGALKGSEPALRITPDADLILDGETFANGTAFPIGRFLGRTVSAKLSNGRDLGTLTFMRGSDIPAVFFTIEADDFQRVNKGTHLDIKNDAAMVMVNGDGSLGAAEVIPSFKTHGNSTFYAAKRAFQFQMEHKVALGGMEKNKKWYLLANWFDISLIRNQMTLDLCREIGLTSTPDCRQVDLYINQAYQGTYLLTEKIQLKKGRLEITDLEETLEKLNGKEAYEKARAKQGSGATSIMHWFTLPQEPEDVSGGFLLELEKALQFSQQTDEAGFVTDQGMPIIIKEPTHAGKKTVDYIAALMNDFHNALLRADGTSKASGRYYASYIDMNSFALKVAVEEFSANYDVRAASQFMYKDADSVDELIYAGPGWDYDLTYGNKDDGMHDPQKADYVFKRSSAESCIYHWLLTHEDFQKITRQRFEEVFVPAAEVLAGYRKPAEGSPLRSVEEYQEAIRDSAAMNFTRWTARSIPDVWDGSGRTFEDAGTFVKNWVRLRLAMMKDQWLVVE